MRILTEKQIKQKIKRLAYQIAEENYSADEVILLGINNNGFAFAKLIQKDLKQVAQAKVTLGRISLNPANPLKDDIVIDLTLDNLRQKVIIIVDDVANTGRTIFYAFKPLMSLLPHKIQVAVLVDRKHKFFPIEVDYVGLSLATTMHDNILVKLIDVDSMEVHLE